MADVVDLSVAEFAWHLEMSMDSKTRFGLLALIGGKKDSPSAVKDTRTDAQKLAAIGIPVLRG